MSTAAPLIPAERAARLLEQVVYERVLGCVDLDELFRFEQELWSALGDCGFETAVLPAVSDAMLEAALSRIAADPDRHGRRLSRSELDDCEPPPFGDCALCEEERREQRPATPQVRTPRAARAGSKQ